MPTMNPRLSVTLTPELSAVMKRMSELTGNSQSAMVGELLEEARPVLERMVKVLQAAKDVKGKVRQDIIASMDQIQTRLEKQLGLGLDLMDEESAPLLAKAEAIVRRGRRGPAPREVPAVAARKRSTPMSNRGVRSPNRSGKTLRNRGSRRGQV